MNRPTLSLSEARSRLMSAMSRFSRKTWSGTWGHADRAAFALESRDIAAADLMLRRLCDYSRPHAELANVCAIAGELADACREFVLVQYGAGMARSSKDVVLVVDKVEGVRVSHEPEAVAG